MKAFIQKIASKYRYSLILLKQLVITDFKLRYQGSVLGYLWSLLKPLAIFVILYVVFVKFMRIGGDIPYYAILLLLGIILWNFFAEVTTGSINAIVGKGDLIRKINFPKYVIVLAGAFSALINLLINLVVVGVFMYFSGVELRWSMLEFPLFVVELALFALGIGFFLSAFYVKFRDIGYIWEVVMQAAFYATPILYPLTDPLKIIPYNIAELLILSPVAQVIQDARHALVTEKAMTIGSMHGGSWLQIVPFAITIGVLLFSAWYFRRESKSFAENS